MASYVSDADRAEKIRTAAPPEPISGNHTAGPRRINLASYSDRAKLQSAEAVTHKQPSEAGSRFNMAAVAMQVDSKPNSTVYVRNLEEKIKIPALTDALDELFSEFGTILEIVAKANLRAKGQAFVVFEDIPSAQRAIDEIQGFELFNKPMQLSFAKTTSDATVKATGTEEDVEAHKRRRQAEKERRQAAEQQAEAAHKLKRPAGPDAVQGGVKTAKLAKGTGLKSTATTAVIPDEYLPPNKILFLQNVPEDYEVESLTTIFSRFEGFKEVRLVPGRKGLAFVEYEAEQGAISAKESTAAMSLGGQQIKVTYQRQ